MFVFNHKRKYCKVYRLNTKILTSSPAHAETADPRCFADIPAWQHVDEHPAATRALLMDSHALHVTAYTMSVATRASLIMSSAKARNGTLDFTPSAKFDRQLLVRTTLATRKRKYVSRNIDLRTQTAEVRKLLGDPTRPLQQTLWFLIRNAGRHGGFLNSPPG